MIEATHGTNRDNWPLIEIVRTFARPMHGRPKQLILDGFDSEFFIRFDFDDAPETPEAKGTCDILVASPTSNDHLAESMRLVANANKFGVMRFLAAIGISRFDDKVKSAFYASSNPLRAN